MRCCIGSRRAGPHCIYRERLTDAEVAASDDLTGLKDLGGDWDLEFSIGDVESELVFTRQVVEYWHGTLDLTAQESEVLVNGSTASNQL